MAVLKCKMCGGQLTIPENASFIECDYCGSVQTLPNLDNEKKMNLFNRANTLRMKKEFDKAAGVYESIVAEFPEEAEAYWGLCLCKFGIEYVDDKKTGRKIPTSHRTSKISILNDSDFKSAFENADVGNRNLYQTEAEVIDGIQKKILEIASKEKPYDIFISYKETDDATGQRTADSGDAQDLYTSLVEKGYRVFFSRVTLRSHAAGENYEPYIFAALNSAKVMILLGSKAEYLNSEWVKNEWSRYLAITENDPAKKLLVCYKKMDAYDLPDEISGLQALDMSSVTFHTDLMQNIGKVIPREDSTQKDDRNVVITDVSFYASNDEDHHWSNGTYLTEVDVDQYRYVYIHVHMNRLEAGTYTFKKVIYDERNVPVYEESSECTYQEPREDSRRSHRWRLHKKDGRSVKPGNYTVKIWFGDSYAYERPLTVYSSKQGAVTASAASSDVEALIRRAEFALQAGEFGDAVGFSQRILDSDPENWKGYRCLFLANQKTSDLDSLSYVSDYRKNSDFMRMVKFAPADVQNELSQISERCEIVKTYWRGYELIQAKKYKEALATLKKIEETYTKIESISPFYGNYQKYVRECNENLQKEETKQNALNELKERLSGDFVMTQTQIPADVLEKYDELEKRAKTVSEQIKYHDTLGTPSFVFLIIATALYIIMSIELLFCLGSEGDIFDAFFGQNNIFSVFGASVVTCLFLEGFLFQGLFDMDVSFVRWGLLFTFGVLAVCMLQMLLVPIPLLAIAGIIGFMVNISFARGNRKQMDAWGASNDFFWEFIWPKIRKMFNDLKNQYVPILGEEETVAMIRKRFMARDVGTLFFGEDEKGEVFDDLLGTNEDEYEEEEGE